MPDEPEVETPAPEAAPSTPETPPAGDAGDAPRTYTAAEYRQVQNEARNLRARLKAAEDAAAGHAPALEALRTEADALRGQVATATEELRGYRLRDAIVASVAEDPALAGLDAALAARLVEGVEYGDDGRPRGLPAALRRIAQQYPQILAAPRVPQQPPAGSPPRATADDAATLRDKRRVAPVL